MDIDTAKPIMVTGATGYVAGWIVKALLEAGCTVHAAVRVPGAADKVNHLKSIAERSPGKILFFAADLMQAGSYDEAMAGCGLVFHTASPFIVDVKDPQKELVEPALHGTRNVLEAVNRIETVSRVVLTSSCAAICGDNADVAKAPGGRLDESVWNTSSNIDHVPYSYSKTVAERAAWEMAEAQDRWKLVVINPCLVIGLALQANPTSESFTLVKRMANGTMRIGAPRWGFGAVDVRDVAQAHIAAGFLPEANGRNIVCGHETDLFAMSQLLKERYGQYPLPRRVAPKWLVWLIAPFMGGGMSQANVSRNVDIAWRADNSKGKRELGVTYRPLKESMESMFEWMIEVGMVERR